LALALAARQTLRDATAAAASIGEHTATRRWADADRRWLLDAWPTLPEALRAGILAMIDAARKDG
jgi:hypothetical protein